MIVSRLLTSSHVVLEPIKRHVLNPIGQGRLLVIDEDSSVLDARLFLHLFNVRESPYALCLASWYVRKPPPRANADLLTDIIQAINRASEIAAGNDKSLVYTR